MRSGRAAFACLVQTGVEVAHDLAVVLGVGLEFGGIGLTQSLGLELAEHNIRVNCVCPGNLLDSPLWVGQLYDEYAKRWGITPEEVRKMYEDKVPMGRGCKYEDVTGLVMFLASDASSYMTGQAINVTGGQVM